MDLSRLCLNMGGCEHNRGATVVDSHLDAGEHHRGPNLMIKERANFWVNTQFDQGITKGFGKLKESVVGLVTQVIFGNIIFCVCK